MHRYIYRIHFVNRMWFVMMGGYAMAEHARDGSGSGRVRARDGFGFGRVQARDGSGFGRVRARDGYCILRRFQ